MQLKQTVLHMFYQTNHSLWEGNLIRNIETAPTFQFLISLNVVNCLFFSPSFWSLYIVIKIFRVTQGFCFLFTFLCIMHTSTIIRLMMGYFFNFSFEIPYLKWASPLITSPSLWNFVPFQCIGNSLNIVICDFIPCV